MTSYENHQVPALKRFNAFFSKSLISKKTVIVIFALFLLCGMLVFRDYGISFDESVERQTSLINYVHFMRPLMLTSEHAAVRRIAQETPELADYSDRFYGVALQCVTVFIEHFFNFELGDRAVYLIRHAFVFLNYFVAGICFYLIIKRRFGNTILPLLGALAFILYPRFFGEAFYNIKDSLFFSWMVISGCFVLRWLETRKIKHCIIAAITLAVAINTRILGLSLLLLACAFAVIISIQKREAFLRAAGRPLALLGLTLAFWILITPFLWENPVKNIIDTFVLFSNFSNWDGAHLYMGEMITRHVPWHYVPVWMGVTVPLPYIAMFIAGTACVCKKTFSYIKRCAAMRDEITAGYADDELEADDLIALDDSPGWHEARQGDNLNAKYAEAHLYDLFFAALFFCTLLGFIVLRISMYEGWRHAYGIFFPFLYLAVYGLGVAIAFMQKKRVMLRRAGGCAVCACFAFLLGWIIINHPYEYVFFNGVGRLVAERNFSLDYWEVSHVDLLRNALVNEPRPFFKVNGLGSHAYMLKDAEAKRMMWTAQLDKADYYLQSTRGTYDSRVAPDGFEEAAAIIVDGMKISKLYRSKAQPLVELDGNAWDYIDHYETNMRRDNVAEMHDHKLGTRWTSNKIQMPGDFLLFKFDRLVNYDFFCMEAGFSPEDVPKDLAVLVSADASSWKEMRYTEFMEGYRFEERPEPFQFIVFEVRAPAPENWWSIHELYFGHTIN